MLSPYHISPPMARQTMVGSDFLSLPRSKSFKSDAFECLQPRGSCQRFIELIEPGQPTVGPVVITSLNDACSDPASALGLQGQVRSRGHQHGC
mmetsp:Transcript_59659/g.106395  ORF Transcript_59659/g.106395 Transcript_59659/m.106395 type:complete len:93 (-) Transcript_59659:624-902(-)